MVKKSKKAVTVSKKMPKKLPYKATPKLQGPVRTGKQEGIRPLGDRVLIKPVSEEESAKTLPSGIIIPATVDKEKTDRGTVVAVGPGKMNESGKTVPMQVRVGETVLFQWGDKVEVDGTEYFVVSESSILAILK